MRELRRDGLVLRWRRRLLRRDVIKDAIRAPHSVIRALKDGAATCFVRAATSSEGRRSVYPATGVNREDVRV